MEGNKESAKVLKGIMSVVPHIAQCLQKRKASCREGLDYCASLLSYTHISVSLPEKYFSPRKGTLRRLKVHQASPHGLRTASLLPTCQFAPPQLHSTLFCFILLNQLWKNLPHCCWHHHQTVSSCS
ncbi:hypothetical protein TRVL_01157 [Trypanosoma vivax]|nr:hypothetical protein TRVL_01157 [Trypanosoma vivax]